MTVLLYGLLAAPADAEPPRGVRALDTAAGVAWVRTLAPAETPTPEEQQAALHAALQAGRTPLPARPGSRFDDDAALVAALARSADTWRSALERVRDRVEMMVFVPTERRDSGLGTRDSGLGNCSPTSPKSRVPSPESRGRAYLERLRAQLAPAPEAERWRTALRDAVGDLATDDAVVVHPSGQGILVSHLVPRDREADYRARVAAWRTAAGVARAVVVGPWPPFSFAADVSR
ncbi:Gas vesicle synthesis GvpLGvpF [Gemmatirosa kalamazoonensis]|uniref:Gas vesicle synthesis GvpLGvpF n=1 Tax=Gemmatirosa kalamazoonensis TaxID=861299 RepID=W0RCF7_9BACT|nr:GvpL/GvpF family gas vesicle protein [Gemmatirosa kalamazoonensis]AHG88476.1 Gas vesicle synthesis GvpLGvpF [Gemmatirosa kalamazoonensis]